MNMQPVASSNLESVGYDNGTLYVRFHDGSLYRYEGVPSSVYAGLMSATSKGSYLHANIAYSYKYERIG